MLCADVEAGDVRYHVMNEEMWMNSPTRMKPYMSTMTLEEEVDIPPTSKQWWSLAVIALGVGLVILDGTIVSVALPDIISALSLNITEAQWVNSLYSVLLAALLLSTGSLADRFGRRLMFVVGVLLFGSGSLVAALSDSAALLISARAVQACGAALIMPAALSTLNATFRGKYRAAAFGIWGAVIAGAAAVGPLAGGFLTQDLSWHWIFLVNLPLCVIVVVGTFVFVAESKGSGFLPGFDVVGAVLSALGFGALIFAVIEGPAIGWWKPEGSFSLFGWHWPQDAAVSAVPVTFAIGSIALIAFVLWERSQALRGRSSILDLDLFRIPTFTLGNIVSVILNIGQMVMFFVLPLYLVNVLALDLIDSGLVLAAAGIGAFFAGAAARHFAAKFGDTGTVLIGFGVQVVAMLALAFWISDHTPIWQLGVSLAIYGLGLGLASALLTGTILEDTPVDASGQASATQSTLRQIGSALGTAIAGVALAMTLNSTLPAALEKTGLPDATAEQLADSTRESAGETITVLRGEGSSSQLGDDTSAAVDALEHGFADASRASMFISLGFLLLGFAAAVWLHLVARRRDAVIVNE